MIVIFLNSLEEDGASYLVQKITKVIEFTSAVNYVDLLNMYLTD